jgi:hypothetical protein
MLIKQQRFVRWRSDTPLLPAVSLITPAYFAAGDTNVGIAPTMAITIDRCSRLFWANLIMRWSDGRGGNTNA